MKTITLSGWGQPYDALAVLAPKATHVDYAKHAHVEDALAEIAAHKADIAIGWSLGGQLLARAVAAGMFRPKKLVLIATPFQFVATAERAVGMKRDLYDKFYNNYAKNPERTLHKAWELIYKDDTRAGYVQEQLARQDKKNVLQKNWLRWLEMLNGFSFEGQHLADFPPTLLIHGDRDAVVTSDQSQRFLQAILHAKLITFNGSGHAPHWHDTQRVKDHLHV